jgi:hypothetical protein
MLRLPRDRRTSLWIAGVLFVSLAWQVSAAVLPLSNDDLAGGPSVSLAAPPLMAALSGEWIGQTACGRRVKLELHAAGSALTGQAMLTGLVPEGSRAVPVTQLMLGGHTMVFKVKRGCGRRAAYGVLTVVSDRSVRLDFQTGTTPVTLTLAKVG